MGDFTFRVDCGDGASMAIQDPRSFADGGLVWRLTYGDVQSIKYSAASVIESYTYLIGPNITQAEAIRRLKLLRAAYKANRPYAPGAVSKPERMI